jgi:hypothetical protein
VYGAPYRIAAYELKLSEARLLSDLTALMPTMTANYAAVVPQITAMELSVKQVCDNVGVPTIQLPFYLDFGREMFARTRADIAGETLALFAAMSIAKWVSRGLTQSILQAIRTDVFSVAAPVAP